MTQRLVIEVFQQTVSLSGILAGFTLTVAVALILPFSDNRATVRQRRLTSGIVCVFLVASALFAGVMVAFGTILQDQSTVTSKINYRSELQIIFDLFSDFGFAGFFAGFWLLLLGIAMLGFQRSKKVGFIASIGAVLAGIYSVVAMWLTS